MQVTLRRVRMTAPMPCASPLLRLLRQQQVKAYHSLMSVDCWVVVSLDTILPVPQHKTLLSRLRAPQHLPDPPDRRMTYSQILEEDSH